MIIIGSRAAELRGIKLRRPPADIDVIGTLDEMEAFRRANADTIQHEKVLGPRRTHFFLKHPLYKKVEFGAEDLPSNTMLRTLCTTDTVLVLKSEAFLPTTNVLGLTKRCHLNYPLYWDKHFRHYSQFVDYMTEPSKEENDYYLQCRLEVKERYARRGVKYRPDPTLFEGKFSLPEDVFEAIAFDPSGPVYKTRKIDPRPGLIRKAAFDALPEIEKIRFVQELFIALGTRQEPKEGHELNKYMVYRHGMRTALRDLYAGWFQDYCLDILAILRFPPEHDYMSGYEAARREGRLRPTDDGARDAEADLARGAMLQAAGRVLEAELSYRAILKYDPNHVGALNNLGILAQGAGRLPYAERILRRALSLDPKSGQVSTSLASVLLSMGRLDEAASNYRKGIQLNARFLPARLGLARTLEKRGQVDEAIQVCRGVLRIAPRDRSAAEALKRLYRSRAQT